MHLQGVQTNTSSTMTNRDVDTTQEGTKYTGGGMEVSNIPRPLRRHNELLVPLF